MASTTLGAGYCCAVATGTHLSLESLQWEAKEFWRMNVVPFRDWKKNTDADEGDVPELNPPPKRFSHDASQ